MSNNRLRLRDIFSHLSEYSDGLVTLRLVAADYLYVYDDDGQIALFGSITTAPPRFVEEAIKDLREASKKVRLLKFLNSDKNGENDYNLNYNDVQTDDRIVFNINLGFDDNSIPETSIKYVMASNTLDNEITNIDGIIQNLKNMADRIDIKEDHVNLEGEYDKEENSVTALYDKVFPVNCNIDVQRSYYDQIIIENIEPSGDYWNNLKTLNHETNKRKYVALILLADLVKSLNCYKNRLLLCKDGKLLFTTKTTIKKHLVVDEDKGGNNVFDIVFDIMPTRALCRVRRGQEDYIADKYIVRIVSGGSMDTCYIYFGTTGKMQDRNDLTKADALSTTFLKEVMKKTGDKIRKYEGDNIIEFTINHKDKK